jgi:hypothetical protein
MKTGGKAMTVASKTLRITILAILVLASSCLLAWSAPRAAFGVGLSTCATWTKARESGDDGYYVISNWALGFVSGVNMAGGMNIADTGPDFLLGTDRNGLTVWIDNYCATHPLDPVIYGATALVKELRSRAR